MAENGGVSQPKNAPNSSPRRPKPSSTKQEKDLCSLHLKPIIVSICFRHYSLMYSCVFMLDLDDSWDLIRTQQWYLEL